MSGLQKRKRREISPKPHCDNTILDYLSVTHSNEHELRRFLTGETLRLRRPGVPGGVLVDEIDAELRSWGGSAGGASLTLKGRALSALRRAARLQPTIVELARLGCRATRVDLALDTTGPLTPSWFRERSLEGRVVSRSRGTHSRGSASDDRAGVYLGSEQSDFYLMIYDRAAWLTEQGKPSSFPRLIRWEQRFSNKSAERVFARIAALNEDVDLQTGEIVWPLDRVFREELGRRVRVTRKPPDRENNNYRVATDRKWQKFVSLDAKTPHSARLEEGGPEASFEACTKWCIRNASPAVAAVHDAGGPGALLRLAEAGRLRLRPQIRGYIHGHAEAARQQIERLLNGHLGTGEATPCA